MSVLHVVGIGPGTQSGLTIGAVKLFTEHKQKFAFRRYLPLLGEGAKEFGPKIADGFAAIEAALGQGDTVLAVTGDPTCFSLLPQLRKQFVNHQIVIHPTCGARTALFSAFGLVANSPVELSGHGRELSEDYFVGTVLTNNQTLLWCDKNRSPQWAKEALIARGLGKIQAYVGSNLTFEDEKLVSGSIQDIDLSSLCGHSILLCCNDAVVNRFWGGLSDSSFIRGTLPMTKAPIRRYVLSLLAPSDDAISWDIGSGTGSVSCELALASPKGHCYAVERVPEGVELAQENAAALGALNLTVLQGQASERMSQLPTPSVVFIGGSGGELEFILSEVARRGAGIRVVISSVTLETSAKAGEILKKLGYKALQVETIAPTRWRILKNNTLAQCDNPVTLWFGITGDLQ